MSNLYNRPMIEASPHQPHWLLTFGDLMSVIACIFIVMVSMGTIDVDRFQTTAASLNIAFRGADLPGDARVRNNESALSAMLVRFKVAIAEQVSNGGEISTGPAVTLDSQRQELKITLSGETFFAPSLATLSAPAVSFVTQLGRISSDANCQIVVRGHATSELESGADSPADVRELSYRRAACIADLLEAAGIPNSAIRIEAYGATAGTAPDRTDLSTGAEDRRVEILIRVNQETQICERA